MDKTVFLQACRSLMEEGHTRRGIGTLGEKSLHAVLKRYFDPCPEHHEIPVGPYVADIRNEEGFIEIQTRGFERLREKLELFLQQGPVTVVYPVPALKWVVWIEEDGSMSQPKKSPKRPTACEILPELYRLKPMLGREGLRFCILLLEVEDYRLKDGYGPDKKRKATKYDRFPVALLDELWISSREEYRLLIPDALPETFTAREYGKAARLSAGKASAAVNVLFSVGALDRVGREKRSYLYSRPDAQTGKTAK